MTVELVDYLLQQQLRLRARLLRALSHRGGRDKTVILLRRKTGQAPLPETTGALSRFPLGRDHVYPAFHLGENSTATGDYIPGIKASQMRSPPSDRGPRDRAVRLEKRAAQGPQQYPQKIKYQSTVDGG